MFQTSMKTLWFAVARALASQAGSAINLSNLEHLSNIVNTHLEQDLVAGSGPTLLTCTLSNRWLARNDCMKPLLLFDVASPN